MEHHDRHSPLVVISACLALVAFSVAAGSALVAWSRTDPQPPRPLVDRSEEIENILSITLGEQLGSTQVELVRYFPTLDQRGASASAVTVRTRGWRYEGWYELRGSHVKLPFVAPGSDRSVLLELQRVATLVGDAGGKSSFAQLVAEFARARPKEVDFYPLAYGDTFTLAHCSDSRHSRIPSRVANRYGDFDPRYVFFHQPPGAESPTAVFGWRDDTGEWRYLGGPEAVAVFENVWIHSGCDVSQEDWYQRRKTMPGTRVLEY